MMAGLQVALSCLILLLSPAMGFSTYAYAAAESNKQISTPPQNSDIEIFVREGCPHCARAKEFLEVLQHEQPNLKISIRDVSREPVAMERLQQLAAGKRAGSARVPAFAIGGELIVGFSDAASTGQLIRDSLARSRQQRQPINEAATSCGAEVVTGCAANEALPVPETEIFSVNFFGQSLSPEKIGLPLFTLTLGLLDGFNPCSLWVLILMISLLAPLRSRSRMLAIAGTFIAVQGIAYFVFMAAWLNLFLLIGLSRISEITIAALALLAGSINLKDFWAFGRGVSLSIPAAAKPGIYTRMRSILQAEHLGAALFGTVVLGILVQIVELMCTSGFPALFTRILTLENMDTASYYGYLLLYDVAYMFDDVLILAIGVVTLSHRRLQEKEGRWLKLLSGLVMVGLGVYLLLQ